MDILANTLYILSMLETNAHGTVKILCYSSSFKEVSDLLLSDMEILINESVLFTTVTISINMIVNRLQQFQI